MVCASLLSGKCLHPGASQLLKIFFFLFSLSFGTTLYVLDTRVIGMALAGLEIELFAFFKKRLRQ